MRDTLIEKKNQTFLPDEMKTFSRKQKQQSFAIKLEERKSASNAQLKDVESRPIVFFLCVNIFCSFIKLEMK